MESSHWASQLWHIIPVFLNITGVKLITPAERVGWRCRMMKGMIFNGNKSTMHDQTAHTYCKTEKAHLDFFFPLWVQWDSSLMGHTEEPLCQNWVLFAIWGCYSFGVGLLLHHCYTMSFVMIIYFQPKTTEWWTLLTANRMQVASA